MVHIVSETKRGLGSLRGKMMKNGLRILMVFQIFQLDAKRAKRQSYAVLGRRLMRKWQPGPGVEHDQADIAPARLSVGENPWPVDLSW